MKKTNLLTGFALLSIACIIVSCKQNTATSGLPGEDTINLSGNVVKPAAQATYTANCAGSISLNGATIASQTFSLANTNVTTMYNQAVAIMNGANPTGKAGFITAIQIWYGIHNNAMTYYFLPVCLQTTPPPSTAGTYTYTLVSTSLPNPFYTINSAGTFTVDAANQIQGDTTNYKTQIIINHFKGDTDEHFIATGLNNPLGDARYIVIPFQEMYQFMSDNNCSGLIVYNIGVPVNIPSGQAYMRHDLSMGAPTGSNGKLGCIFLNNYADLDHMVPPDQSSLSYTITTPWLATGSASN